LTFSLIPFGLHQDTGEFLDITEVPGGKKCGCICPSCGTPLIARQGNVNQWHFAHASRAVYGKTEEECDYSFYVSVRMMAKQLFSSIRSIKTPEYRSTVGRHEPGFLPIDKEFIVTTEKQITFDNVDIETEFEGISVDVVASISGFSLIIYLSHANRQVPEDLKLIKGHQYGVLDLSLSDSYALLYGHSNSGSFTEALRQYLTDDIRNKQWFYHPKYNDAKQAAVKSLRKAELTPLTKTPPEPRYGFRAPSHLGNCSGLARTRSRKVDKPMSQAEEKKQAIRLEWLSYKKEFQKQYGHAPSDEEIRHHNPVLYDKKLNYNKIK